MVWGKVGIGQWVASLPEVWLELYFWSVVKEVRQGETAWRWRLKSLGKAKTKQWSQRRHSWGEVCFRPVCSIYKLLFIRNALLRSPWADLRPQPVVVQGLLPYLVLLTKGLVSSAFAGKIEGFSYLLSSMAKTEPAEERDRLDSTLPTTWHLGH